MSGYFNQVYLHGEELTFVVIDQASNRSIEVKHNALIDDVAPSAASNITLTSDGLLLVRLSQMQRLKLLINMVQLSQQLMFGTMAHLINGLI